MDRPIIFPGELPVAADVLFGWRAAMISDGNILGMIFGTATLFDGLGVTPTSPASMSVNVAPGRILVSTVVDSNTYGSLTTDSDAVMKLGINTETVVLGPFTPPVTAGQSVDIVVEAAFSEADSGSVVLPYFNAANPSSPFSGPANAGTPQNTRRLQTVTLNVLIGTPATTGSQTVPGPLTSGFVGVAVITVANGATTITSGMISAYPGAPSVAARPGATNQGFGSIIELTSGSGNWIVPNGVTRCRVTEDGGGGGGGGSGGNGGSGGGGGGRAVQYYTGLIAGTAIPWVVGAAGAAGATGAAGGAGGATTFGSVGTTGTVLTANGGGGGAPNAGAPGAGGSASGGGVNDPGAAGSKADQAGVGDGGSGGNAGSGAAGAQWVGPNSAGNSGMAPGAGGGGSGQSGSGAGGAGGPGRVTIEF